jgi:hypothetical protein
MRIEYRNLFTHFIFTTQNRIPCIPEENRERIEKYIPFAEEYEMFMKHYKEKLLFKKQGDKV